MTALDRIRAICMAQPRAAEKLSHGMPVFFIEKGKTYAWYSENHHGNGITAVLVKTSGPDEQDALVEMDPDLFYKPAYLAPVLTALRAVLAGTRDPALADDPALRYAAAAEILMLLERLRAFEQHQT